ncbi:MAG: YgjV family protein [bacterium]
MFNIVLANFFDIIDNVLYLFSSKQTLKKKTMMFQSIGCTFGIISKFLLGGYIGCALGFISLFRNMLIYSNNYKKYFVCIVVLLQIAILYIYRTEEVLGLLACFASALYSTALYYSKSARVMNISIIINVFLWFFYNISILSFTAAFFNALTFFLVLIALFKDLSTKKPKLLTYNAK